MYAILMILVAVFVCLNCDSYRSNVWWLIVGKCGWTDLYSLDSVQVVYRVSDGGEGGFGGFSVTTKDKTHQTRPTCPPASLPGVSAISVNFFRGLDVIGTTLLFSSNPATIASDPLAPPAFISTVEVEPDVHC